MGKVFVLTVNKENDLIDKYIQYRPYGDYKFFTHLGKPPNPQLGVYTMYGEPVTTQIRTTLPEGMTVATTPEEPTAWRREYLAEVVNELTTGNLITEQQVRTILTGEPDEE